MKAIPPRQFDHSRKFPSLLQTLRLVLTLILKEKPNTCLTQSLLKAFAKRTYLSMGRLTAEYSLEFLSIFFLFL